jgi:hypothetical protein
LVTITDQEVGAGDADIGGEEAFAQHRARLGQQRRGLGEIAVVLQRFVVRAERRLDLVLGDMDRRRDDMARRLVAKLNNVLAEIGLDRGHAVLFEELVDGDLLADHRLALGDGLRADEAADVENGRARVFGRAAPVDRAAILGHLGLEALEIEIKVRDRVVLDRARLVAQRVELGQLLDHRGAASDEARLRIGERGLQPLVDQGVAGILLEALGGRFHLSA